MERHPGLGPEQLAEALWRPDARETKSLFGELLFIRKETGFTPTRIKKVPVLERLLGGPDESFEGLRDRLISAIHSLHDPQPELLLDVFGVTTDTEGMPTLKSRREHYGAKIGLKAEAVADREPAALENLRIQLVTGWYPKSPTSFRVPESHNGFVQESVQILTVVKDRMWQETREHYRLLAAFDEADFISISSSFPGRPVPLGDFTVRTMRIGESFTHQFWYKEPMRRGRTYDLRFRLLPDADLGEAGALTEESRAFHEPTRTALFEALFIGERPRLAWSYSRLSFFERPGSPQRGQDFNSSAAPSIRAQFDDLYGGLHSGLAWTWRLAEA